MRLPAAPDPPAEDAHALTRHPLSSYQPSLPTRNEGALLPMCTPPPDLPISPPSDERRPSAAGSEPAREIDVDWAAMDPTITPQERGLAILDAISDSLRLPRHWQGDHLTIMGVPVHWHPVLGYITIPDDDPPGAQ